MARTDRKTGLSGTTQFKVPVQAATTANITLSGEQTIDGIAVVSDDRVLVKNQTDGSENGIYNVDTGAWTRSNDWDGTNDVLKGTLVFVPSGATNQGFWFVDTADPIVIGTTSISFTLTFATSGTAITVGQFQNQTGVYVATVAGTADAITLTPSTAIVAYAAGQRFAFLSSGANTGAVTVNISGIGAKAVTKFGATALVANDISAASVMLVIEYDGTQFQLKDFLTTGTSGHKVPLLDGINTHSGINIFSGVPIGKFPVTTNFRLAATVAASALTIAIKGIDGNDPSATNPVYVPFRNITLATGDVSWLVLTAATSLVISSGSTLGTVSAQLSRIWIVGFDDGGTFRLGAINCLDSTLNIFPLQSDALASSTAEGGAGAADAAGVFYTGAAVVTRPYTVLGYVESTQATAGTWASAPSKQQVWISGMKLPGDVVQVAVLQDGIVATGTTVGPLADNTIPQNTEGDEYLSKAITPTSLVNKLEIDSQIVIANSAVAGGNISSVLFQDAIANALAAVTERSDAADAMVHFNIRHGMLAGTVSSTTFRIRAGNTTAGTTTFNGRLGAQVFGGVLNSFLKISEIQT